MSDEAVVLQASGLKKTFDEGRDIHVKVLDGVDIEVSRGEMVAILGSSGSGKSTLLHLLGGLEKADSGSVHVLGQDIFALSEKARAALRNHYLGFVYQFHHLLPEFNAIENVMMPLLIRGVSYSDAASTAAEIISKVGLENRHKHKVSELSGGERQRIALARALVTEPACVLADEPTGNLDTDSAHKVYELMRHLNQTLGTSFIVVTHDQALAKQMDRSLKLKGGLLHNMEAIAES